jgi:SAM-dependent methyltransferase
MSRNLHEENRLSWNEATVAHNSHKGDQARFFREGGNTLHLEEMEMLGDITGLAVLHLQCNSGQDTLSLAQMGANMTGVDISDTAIDFARKLSAESGVPASFHRMDVYDWLEQTAGGTQRFDIVFSSYGALCWLSDLKQWAKGIAAVLKAGGRFIVVEYHPVMQMYDEQLERRFPYFSEGRALTWEEGVGDYVGQSSIGLPASEFVEGIKGFRNPYRAHEFIWGIAEVVTALLEAGLTITTLKEYPYANGFKPFEHMRQDGRRWLLPEEQPNMPLMYALAAQKR